jgi:hypothetical protein
MRSSRPAFLRPPKRASRRREAGSAPNKRTAGQRAAAILLQCSGSLSAPRIALKQRSDCATRNAGGDAHAATPYLCFRSRTSNRASPELTWASHPRRPRVRTPEAGRYPARVPQALSPPLAYARTSGAASQVPNDRRSAPRVLLDEGCTQCKRDSGAGDNEVIARDHNLVMAGLVPAIHVFVSRMEIRGCPALRPGMTVKNLPRLPRRVSGHKPGHAAHAGTLGTREVLLTQPR